MHDLIKNLSEATKGYILMIAGLILLLHTLRILENWLNYLLIAAALFMIAYGFMVSGLYEASVKALKKRNVK